MVKVDKILDLVKFVMCTLVSRADMTFYILIKMHTVPEHKGTHDKLNQIKIFCTNEAEVCPYVTLSVCVSQSQGILVDTFLYSISILVRSFLTSKLLQNPGGKAGPTSEILGGPMINNSSTTTDQQYAMLIPATPSCPLIATTFPHTAAVVGGGQGVGGSRMHPHPHHPHAYSTLPLSCTTESLLSPSSYCGSGSGVGGSGQPSSGSSTSGGGCSSSTTVTGGGASTSGRDSGSPGKFNFPLLKSGEVS